MIKMNKIGSEKTQNRKAKQNWLLCIRQLQTWLKELVKKKNQKKKKVELVSFPSLLVIPILPIVSKLYFSEVSWINQYALPNYP